MPRDLTEKTLELHVHAEIYHNFQQQGVTPVMVGFSQAEEIALGADSQVRWGIGPSARAIILQFKKASRWKRQFTFYINNNSQNNQHAMLLGFGSREQLPAYYVLPLVGTEQELVRNTPGMLSQTVLLEAAGIGSLNPSNKPHRIVIQKSSFTQVKVFSTPTSAPLIRFSQLLNDLLQQTAGITVAQLKTMLSPDSSFRLEFRQGWWAETLPDLQQRWRRLMDLRRDENPLDVLPQELRDIFHRFIEQDTAQRFSSLLEAKPDALGHEEITFLINVVPVEDVLLRSLNFIFFKFNSVVD